MTEDDGVYCTNCRAQISADAPFCPECGAEQAHVRRTGSDENNNSEHLPFDKEYCSHCGDVIPTEVPYCPVCGSEQPPNSDLQTDSSNSDENSLNDDYSWIFGFKSDSTYRNATVGALYVLYFPIGVIFLIYSYFTGKLGWSHRKTGVAFGSIILSAFIVLLGIGLVFQPAPASNMSQAEGEQPTTEETQESPTRTDAEPHIGEADIDIQNDIGQNHIGFDVTTYFEDSAVLIIQLTDGEDVTQRSFEGDSTRSTEQEFNDDIEPPETLEDDEEFQVIFSLSVNGDIVDQRTMSGTYSE